MDENLNVDDLFKNLTQPEMQMMADILSGKSKKINPKTKQILLSKMQKSTSQPEKIIPVKQMNEMDEEEKIKYKEELKNKLKNKTKSQQNLRQTKKNIENPPQKKSNNKKLADTIISNLEEKKEEKEEKEELNELNEYLN